MIIRCWRKKLGHGRKEV